MQRSPAPWRYSGLVHPRSPKNAKPGRRAIRRREARARRDSWSRRRTCRCARPPSTCRAPPDRGRRGCRAGLPRTPPALRDGRGTRRDSRRPRGDFPRRLAIPEGSGTYEAFELALDAELRALALEERFECGFILNVFVDFHVGGGIVAAMHPAALHAALLFHGSEQRLYRGAYVFVPVWRHFVIDVVVHTGITASSSPPALSTTTPPLNCCPGCSRVPAGAGRRTMRRFTWPRYCARATIS